MISQKKDFIKKGQGVFLEGEFGHMDAFITIHEIKLNPSSFSVLLLI